jgi:hypothetical protein
VKWSDLTAEHNGMRVKVSSMGTPQHPQEYIETTGTVVLVENGHVPILSNLDPPWSSSAIANFADWFNVEILD